MDKFKIVFVSNHLYGGGSERVLITLANFFCNKHDVNIISFDNGKTYPIDKKIKVYNVGQSSNLFLQAIRIRKRIEKIQPDIIISFEYFVNLCTILGSLKIKSKLIVSERNDPAIVGSGFIKDILRNYLYGKIDTLVCQTDEAKKYFPKKIQEKSVVILNPLKENLPKIYKGIRKKEIVTFCRLNKQKNIPMLINAFEKFHNKYSDYSLKIYGDGPEKNELQKIVNMKKLNNNIMIKHNISNIHECILKSTMFISTSNYEGLSNSMLESLAIGLPTICTDCPCGGARMIIKNKYNGVLISRNNIDELVIAMDKIASDKNYANYLSHNAIKIREELDITKIAMQWERLFR